MILCRCALTWSELFYWNWFWRLMQHCRANGATTPGLWVLSCQGRAGLKIHKPIVWKQTCLQWSSLENITAVGICIGKLFKTSEINRSSNCRCSFSVVLKDGFWNFEKVLRRTSVVIYFYLKCSTANLLASNS